MPDPLLDVRHLRVEFPTRRGTLVALDDISFAITPGEILGVVGESGAGKSLTGSAIIGLLDPPGRIAAGEIRFDGRRIDNLPYEEMRKVRGRSIGAIFQDPLTSLDPLYTIGQQLVETIQTHLAVNAEEARRRAVRLLQETGIPAAEERLEQYPHQFSGGMRQRVVIALALAGEPKLIVADEPTTALDVSIQAQIISLLKRLCKEHGAAVMLVTHDMGVIAETCDRVAVMYAGRIVEIGPVGAVIHSPAHPYTAGLMGSIPAMDEDRPRLLQIDGAMPRLTAIPAGCAFNPRWKVQDIVAEPLREHGFAEGKSGAETDRQLVARVAELLNSVGLAAADAEKFPHQFSGGQRQRISIARALATQPEFLVCDEPTSALDVSVQAQVLNIMKDLQAKQGLTYLFISHNLAVVRHVSDHVGVMYLGRIVEIADKATLFAAPRHPYTRMLLDAIPDIHMSGRSRTPVQGEVPNPLNPPSGCTFHPRCPHGNERCRVERPELLSFGGARVACHAVEEGRI